MLEKKLGFTLIEVLAVIIVIAVVASILTPLVLNTIESVRKRALKNTAYGIIKSGELFYQNELFEGGNNELTFFYNDGVETSNV
ncbi:MAG: prepilin-type N-terminal cleavage/methylation domain-containing protein [Bacilli bacterium]|nr:prepilin-type N-terminal cleavage/methylation domain-containing protein [Bacilli bacterium]